MSADQRPSVAGQVERSVGPLVTTVWVAPTARRRYLTKRAAIHAEARALIKKRHPTERSHADNFGRIEDPGWHWSTLPRADVLFRRVCRLVGKAAQHVDASHVDASSSIRPLYTTPPAQPAPVQEPRARLMTYIGEGPYPKQGYTVARTYEECPENQYPDAWKEGEKLYTTPPAQPAPVREPSFWVVRLKDQKMVDLFFEKEKADEWVLQFHEGCAWVEPLYTAAQPAVPEEIMHWDGDDGEDGPSGDIASLLNNIVSNRDLEVGEVVHITRATRLPDVWVRVTNIPKDADVEYEVIPAAPEKGQP